MNVDFAIIAALLAAIYGYMKVAMDTVYVINNKRDLVLDSDEVGLRLDRSRKCHLIHTDVIPLIIGLTLFMSVFTVAFFVVGVAIFIETYPDVHKYVAYLFFAATATSLYAIWIVVIKNSFSLKLMKAHVINMDDNNKQLRPITCCIGKCRLSRQA